MNPIAPSLIGQLNNNYVLWFKRSNQYVVVSEIIKDLLEVYLKTLNKSSFSEALSKHGIPKEEALSFYNEFRDFIDKANATVADSTLSTPNPKLPVLSQNIKYYSFGGFLIRFNCESLEIEKLVQPKWAHAEVNQTFNVNVTFHVFTKDHHLHLFRNNEFIGQYPIKEYHLLQGQIALQLINTFYTKTEADWIATFHASTVCNDEEAIMLIGASGNGKSTLSAVLMASGIDVLADDFTPLLAENKEVYRFPSGISVKEGAFSMLEDLYPDFKEYPLYKSTSKDVTIKYIPPIKDLKTGNSHFPCKKIVYVKYDPNAESSLTKVGTEKILETLIPESWLSPLASNAELFLEWLTELQCYELTYSDNTVAVSKIKELFER